MWGSDRCDPGGRWQVRSWWAGWMRVRGERNKLGRRRLTWRSSSQQFQWLILTLLEKKRVRAHTHTLKEGECVSCVSILTFSNFELLKPDSTFWWWVMGTSDLKVNLINASTGHSTLIGCPVKDILKCWTTMCNTELGRRKKWQNKLGVWFYFPGFELFCIVYFSISF